MKYGTSESSAILNGEKLLLGPSDATGNRRLLAAPRRAARRPRRVCGKIAASSCAACGASFEGRQPMQIHKEVDARGLNCPLPILRAKKALADMESGQILKVLATDPGSQRDFAAFAKQTGNEIVEVTTQDKTFVFLMRRR